MRTNPEETVGFRIPVGRSDIHTPVSDLPLPSAHCAAVPVPVGSSSAVPVAVLHRASWSAQSPVFHAAELPVPSGEPLPDLPAFVLQMPVPVSALPGFGIVSQARSGSFADPGFSVHVPVSVSGTLLPVQQKCAASLPDTVRFRILRAPEVPLFSLLPYILLLHLPPGIPGFWHWHFRCHWFFRCHRVLGFLGFFKILLLDFGLLHLFCVGTFLFG